MVQVPDFDRGVLEGLGVCLIIAAFSSNLTIVLLALLLVRSALSQMDVPTHVLRHGGGDTGRADGRRERDCSSAQLGIRRLSGAVRRLLSTSFAGLPLVVCGVLKIGYDLSLLFSFRHIKPPEEKEAPH